MIPDKAVAVIESFQPYNRPDAAALSSNLLWQLHEINRIDKHRRISVRATAARVDTHAVATTTAIEDGCELVVPYDAEPAFEPVFTPMVVFGDRQAGITMQIDGIERMYTLVAQVILPRLAGCA
jgi:hypothetical protein